MRKVHTLVALAGATLVVMACGPMPGYRPPAPHEQPQPGADDEDYGYEDEEDWDEEDEASFVTPPDQRPPPPVRRAPDFDAPSTPPAAPPPEAASSSSGGPGVRVIKIDEESAYIIDAPRGLCFFRFQGTLAPVDCARIEADTGVTLGPAPSRSPPAAPPQQPPPEPPPRPAGNFSSAEVQRFHQAFSAIFCDRVRRADTPPETRMREAGLDKARYEAIEIWMADDDGRWGDATDKARQACR